MSIDDREIDLTVDRKFRSFNNLDSFLSNSFTGVLNKIYVTKRSIREKVTNIRKNFKYGYVDVLDENYYDIMWFTRIPWKSRKITSDNDFKDNRERLNKEDRISDELRVLVRTTSDNKLMITSTKAEELYNSEIFEEFCFEILGKEPFSSMNICPQCGRKVISTIKNKFLFTRCKYCRGGVIDSGLPWERRGRLRLS